jgi:hypothetical protein
VSLTAMLLMTYGVGASIGPLASGVLMKMFGSNMLYAFVCFTALILTLRIRPKAVTNLHQVEDAPLHHIAMPDSMSSSPLVVALDPRVDEQVVQDQMQTTVEPEAEADGESGAATHSEAEAPLSDEYMAPATSEEATTEPQPARPNPAHEASHDLGIDRPM